MRDVAIQETLDTLGAAIRAARKEQGFSQEGFAAHAGIDRSYFGAIERGEFNITIGTLTTIAAGLDVPAWTLLKRGQAGERDA
ncbi:MAG: helix-turn-helix domain-containing protein [Solirubrobacteraceae bacterium]